MTIRRGGGYPPATYEQVVAGSVESCGQAVDRRQRDADEQAQRRWALGRAYPLAKQLTEILELEDEGLAATAKALRQRIGSALSSPDDQ